MYLSHDLIQRIKANYPFYKEAALRVNLPWQMIAAVHYREHNCIPTSPGPGGPFQNDPPLSDESVKKLCLYYKLPFKRPEKDFFTACIIAAHWLQSKANFQLSRNETNLMQIADSFWGYNGRAYGSFMYSPYVMNYHKGQILRVKGTYLDKNGVRHVVDTPDARPGAMLIFMELVALFPSEELDEALLKTQYEAL